jgi:mannose-1-phosphate guanylyltransferase/mannose-6-phosphate isomerase
MAHLIPVILSGGYGTRLWPLSRPLKPKQLLPLAAPRSLLQETFLRMRAVSTSVDGPPIVVCNEQHRFSVSEQLSELDTSPRSIVLEPGARNTAPAIAAAALLALSRESAGKEPLLMVMPADHLIRDVAAFGRAVDAAVDAAAEGRLVTFGVVPTAPATGYGYLLKGTNRGRWSSVERFVEKPDAETAARYVASGGYLWNSGMFLLPANLYLEELAIHAPAVLSACRRATKDIKTDGDFLWLGPSFLESPSVSIDYAVMERTEKAAVVLLDAGWSDIGSWNAVHDAAEKDGAGNVVHGDVLATDCKNSYIVATSRLVAAIGLEDVVIIETEDAVLVMPRERSQDVKRVVDTLTQAGHISVRDAAPPK